MMPAKPASMAPKPNTISEQAPDVDAERRHHRGVGGAGAHQHADPGVGHQNIKQQRRQPARTR